MAIVHMAHKFEEIPAGAVNVEDRSNDYRPQVSTNCTCSDPATHWCWTPERVAAFTLYTYETHNGLCIREYERNGYNDSDFYMVVWNEADQKPQSIEFASTRGWSYPCLGSYVDATPEVLAKYEAYEAARRDRERKAYEAAQALIPAKGKTLEVIKGRKVAKGTKGLCIWTGAGTWGKRVGLKDASGNVHWTALSNVRVVL